MNIAIFSDSFYPSTGGTEQAVFSYATQLVLNGHNVLVACPKAGKCADNYTFSVVRFASIRVTANDFCAVRMSKKNIKKITDFNPDIIHIQTVSPMCKYGLKLAKILDVPAVMTVHTKFKQAFQNDIKIKFIVDILIKKMVKRLNLANAVCTVSEDMARQLVLYGYNGKTSVIRNGMNLKEKLNTKNITENLIKKHNLDGMAVFLFVGRMVKEKNLSFLVKALTFLPHDFDYKMIFVGRGKYQNALKKQIKAFGLSNKIIFTGRVENEREFQAYYQISDLFLFPSLFDNDPLVLVEAACESVSALVLDNCGSSERITNGQNGFISENNPKKFANKIIEIMQNKEKLKECGINASTTIPLTWAQTVAKYEEIYNNLLTKK